MNLAKVETEVLPREPAPAHTSRNGVAKVIDPVNILIVDDREDKLLALQAILEPLGQNLVMARSGKAALRLLLKQEFAVILMDVSMPGMDGFETASLVRTRPRSEHTPIIFITSIGNSPTQMYRGYSLGAVDYILTPIVSEVLQAKIRVFVDLWKQAEQIRQQSDRLRLMEEAEHRRRLAEAFDRLETETKRNRFFTLAVDMLGIADFEGRLIQVNPSWESTLGYTESELKALTGLDLVHPDDRAEMAAKLAELRAGSGIARFEARYRHKDGSYRWLGWTAATFPEEKIIYIFARDVTVRKQNEEQITRLNRELEQRVADLTDVNRELGAFNYSISHDLRAPLRSMSGFAQALLEHEAVNLGPHGLDYARRIVRSARYMDDLLRDLLAYSSVARADMPLAVVHLEEALAQIMAMREEDFRERNAQIDILSPLGTVVANLPTLQQILANLIDNSIKFVSADLPPMIRVSSVREGEFVRLWVEDNGIGIAPEHHQKVFGLFERLHPAHTFPGTGIGLAIVRKGVERMGGRVGVESEPGRGSRFWVDLPAAPAQDENRK
jgi:PAS domain S-box-containing protein